MEHSSAASQMFVVELRQSKNQGDISSLAKDLQGAHRTQAAPRIQQGAGSTPVEVRESTAPLPFG